MASEEPGPPAFIPPARDELIAGIRKACGATQTSLNRRALTDMLEDAADAVTDALEPRSILKRTDITGLEQGVLSGREVSVASRKICRIVAGMDRAASIFGFALTLGAGLDALTARTQRTSLSRALFLDAAGSFLAERWAVRIEDHLRSALAHQDLELSARFSPGYCDWDIESGQRELFRFLSPEVIGISLLPSAMMSPVKSITGICIAAGRVPHRTPCAECRKQHCRYRRADDNRL